MKNLLLFLSVTFALGSRAAVHIVDISDFQFSPTPLVANVNDVIRFRLASGFHNTASTSVPPGASPWASPIMSTPGQTFDYTVTVPGNYAYQCQVHPFMTGTIMVNAVAPVKLSGFSVKIADKGKAILNWQTLTEDNANYFSVQRSADGRDFNEVGRVKAKGNSSIAVNYAFTDHDLDQSARYYYYQLLTVDLDGKEERSKIVLLKQEVKEKKIIVKLSPNPVKSGDHLLLWFNADHQGKLRATIFDVSGKLVYKYDLSTYTGVNFGHLHIHDLSAGLYVLKLSIGNLRETVSITVQ